MFYEHVKFLSHESLNAAHRLVLGFKKSLVRIAANPFQFPFADELDVPHIPPNALRKCLFESRYKALFRLKDNEAYVIAVIDSRRENRDALGEDWC